MTLVYIAIKYDMQKSIPFYVAKTCSYMLMTTIFVFLEEGRVHAIIIGRTKNIFFYPDRLTFRTETANLFLYLALSTK